MAPWVRNAKTMNEPKVAVTYIGDPENENDGPKMLESWGFSFPKGEPVEVPESLAARLDKSAHFMVGEAIADDQGPATEQPKSLDDMSIAELRAMADERGIGHAGVGKADLREMLRG